MAIWGPRGGNQTRGTRCRSGDDYCGKIAVLRKAKYGKNRGGRDGRRLGAEWLCVGGAISKRGTRRSTACDSSRAALSRELSYSESGQIAFLLEAMAITGFGMVLLFQ